VPFRTTSEQLGAWHFCGEPVHTLLMQSVGTLQPPPAGHLAQLPPQSTSVSRPFMVPSLQLGALHTLPVQTPDVQSVPAAHARVTSHFGHAAPPQSTSVSRPFFTTS
jgi:hypothetical protein